MTDQTPHDDSAEKAVLGSILQSPTALGDVVNILKSSDFYNPRHEEIYTAALELFNKGEVVEPVAVMTTLSREGRASKVGGAPYLHELIESVPTVANVTYWAQQVSELAQLRRIAEHSMRMEQLAKSSTATPQDLLALAYNELDRINSGSSGRLAVSASEAFDSSVGLLQEFEENKGRTGVLTGFPDLDHMLSGLRPGQMITVAARPGVGKALAIDTPIPTPAGWAEMGNLNVGDLVYGPDGKPTRVVAATDVMTDRQCYRLTFSDGSTVIADAEHLWYTESDAERKSRRYRAKHKSEARTWLPGAAISAMESDLHAVDARSGSDWISGPDFARKYGIHPDSPIFVGALSTISVTRTMPVSAMVPMLTYDAANARLALGIDSGPLTELDGEVTLGELALATKKSRKSVKSELQRCGIPSKKKSLPSAVATRNVKHYRAIDVLLAVLAVARKPVGGPKSTMPRGSVRTTREIAQTLTTAGGKSNHAVPVSAPLAGAETDLPLPPYTLGAWLGDGTSAGNSLTTTDAQILNNIASEGIHISDLSDPIMYGLHVDEVLPPMGECSCELCGESFKPNVRGQRFCSHACGYAGRSAPSNTDGTSDCIRCGQPVLGDIQIHAGCRTAFKSVLRELGVLNSKHIPVAYLRASEEQRRALLAGLMDTDGSVSGGGGSIFHTTSPRLAEDVYELIVSLGYRCSVSTKPVDGRTPESSTSYNLTFTSSDEVFRLDRKSTAVDSRRVNPSPERTAYRYIVAAEEIESVPVRCIQVDREDGLFLATKAMIITHNSTLSLDICRHATIFQGKTALFFTLEMSHDELMMRLISAHAQVELGHMRAGTMTDDEWQRVYARSEHIQSAKLFIDDTPGITPGEIKAKARRIQAQHGLDLIVIDYLQLMSSGSRVESRQQEVSDFSRSIKLMAKELGVPVIAVSQLNRGSENRTDKKPQLSDLRESGAIEQDSDVVILIYREDQVNPETERVGEADIIIAKQRSGPQGTVPLAWQGQYSRFANLARDF